jgi:LPXTG-site transpeptidase (sortase) family protein
MKLLKDIVGFITTFSFVFLFVFLLLNLPGVISFVRFYISGEFTAQQMITALGLQEKEFLPLKKSEGLKFSELSLPPLDISVAPLDFRIIIPKIGVNAPIQEMSVGKQQILWSGFENDVQKVLREGILHYPHTAYPGQRGNAFFTGHSSYYPWDTGKYKDVFAQLIQLDIGDEYYVYWNQKRYAYTVKEKKEVSPYDVSVLSQETEEKLSTIMTCWPLGTVLRRLIIVGEQQE